MTTYLERPDTRWSSARSIDVVLNRSCAGELAISGNAADSTVRLHHSLPLDRIDNSVVETVADALRRSGTVLTDDLLGDLVTALVLSTEPDPLTAWLGYYDRTLRRLTSTSTSTASDQLDVFAEVYRMAAGLVVGPTVLDVGSCLGFLPILLTGLGHDVLAVDLDHRAMDLLAEVSRRRGPEVRAVGGNATALPCRSGSVETALSIHVLEHLPELAGEVALDELLRVAARRVVVAVPFEPVPTPVYGHVRRFDLAALDALAHRLCRRRDVAGVTVVEHHGGWLVIDKH